MDAKNIQPGFRYFGRVMFLGFCLCFKEQKNSFAGKLQSER